MHGFDQPFTLERLAVLSAFVIAGCSGNEPDVPPARAATSAASAAQGTSGSAVRQPGAGLPPRRAIAGIAGFQISSRIEYAAQPGKLHVLSAIYLFPERVRVSISLPQDRLVDRVILYRRGARGFFLDRDRADSREVTGLELEDLILQTELRRALFLWPDGFEWRGDARERNVELDSRGRLVAQLGDDGRPKAMRSFDAAGRGLETLVGISWQKKGARHFPSRFTLVAGAERIWSEEVLEVETALDYIDAFFLPPDRRSRNAAPVSAAPAIEAIDLPIVWEVRVPLEPELDLPKARAAAEAARASWRERGLDALEPTILELDRGARPIACVLQAPSVGTPPPQGWSLRAERPGWSLALPEAALDPQSIETLAVHLALDADTTVFELHLSRSGSGSESARLVVAQRIR